MRANPMLLGDFKMSSFENQAISAEDNGAFSWVNLEDTTFAHQLATYVAFNSPMEFIANQSNLLLHETLIGHAHDFINQVPSVWNETIILPQTDVGEIDVVARRSACDWFIYLLSGLESKKTVTINIADIVSDYSKMEFVLYVDDLPFDDYFNEGLNGSLRNSNLIQTMELPFKKIIKKAQRHLTFDVAPKGGAVVWLKSSNSK